VTVKERETELVRSVAPLAVSGNDIGKETALYLPLQRKRKMCKELVENSVRMSVSSHWSVCAEFGEWRADLAAVIVCQIAHIIVFVPVCVVATCLATAVLLWM
jgi:hypothetical protein